MSVRLSYKFKNQISETLAFGTLGVSGEGTERTLDSGTDPPVTKQAGGEHTLAAGAETLDLTAILNQAGAAVDFTGLKVQSIFIKANAANTATIKFKTGATNGYNLFGSAGGEISLSSNTAKTWGDECMLVFADTLPDVAAGAKTIDVSSSDVDAKYDITLVAG